MAFGFIYFLSELKRREVYRVAAAYAAVGVAISVAVPGAFGPSSWAAPLVIVLLILGFPVALVLAWTVEVTPEGIQRTEASAEVGAGSPKPGSAAEGHRVSGEAEFQDHAELTAKAAPGANGARFSPQAADLERRQDSSPLGTSVQASPSPDPQSVAVLPFSDLGTDPQHRFFNDGVTEDVLAHLGKIGALRVTSRTSVMRFKGTDKSIREISRELGVAHVLEGSVRAMGNRVRIDLRHRPGGILMDSTARLRATLSHRYRIEREIGRGGMDPVYPARSRSSCAPRADE